MADNLYLELRSNYTDQATTKRNYVHPDLTIFWHEQMKGKDCEPPEKKNQFLWGLFFDMNRIDATTFDILQKYSKLL